MDANAVPDARAHPPADDCHADALANSRLMGSNTVGGMLGDLCWWAAQPGSALREHIRLEVAGAGLSLLSLLEVADYRSVHGGCAVSDTNDASNTAADSDSDDTIADMATKALTDAGTNSKTNTIADTASNTLTNTSTNTIANTASDAPTDAGTHCGTYLGANTEPDPAAIGSDAGLLLAVCNEHGLAQERAAVPDCTAWPDPDRLRREAVHMQ